MGAALCIGIAICNTSCRDQQRIAAKTAKTLERVEQLKAEAAARDTSGVTDSFKKHPVGKRGPEAVESAIGTLDRDITSLQERKKDLEAEVAVLQKELTDYKARNY